MAFQYWLQREEPQPQKTKFIALGEAYHGDTLGSASVSGIARFHALFKPLLFDVIRGPLPDARKIPKDYSTADAYAYFAEQIRYLTLKHRDEVAALVIEPIVQCAAGMVMHPPGFLKEVRKLTEQRGILLIADEVAVGFGRTGTMFACEQEDVVPDIICLGKGLSGGYLPLAATITNSDIYGAFLGEFHEGRTLHHGHTFSGNPLACAAALACLDLFDEERTLAKLPEKISRLSDHLCRLAELPHVATTRQRGLIGALELTPDKSIGLPYPANERRAWRVCREALAHGVWLRPLGDVLYVMPPLAISMSELDTLMETLSAAIDKVTG
jgi:adenosylmethionine-8-amino-7-oxononanoate aminotransferase